jgi:hypothetical protein
MTQERMLKIYDDYLPQVLSALKKYYADLPREEGDDANFFGEFATKSKLKEMRSDPLQKKHAETMTPQNIEALEEDAYTQQEILETIAEQVLKKMTSRDKRALNVTEDFESENEVVQDMLNQALKGRALQEYGEELPEFIYRGVGGEASDVDYEKQGFEGAEEKYPGREDEAESGRVVFISSEPSVAASYARKDKFDRAGSLPTNYGDSIYRIRTKGLDPKLFKKDVGATPDELLFGPQFRYNASIPQEDVVIIDQSGTERTVPRIEKMSYLSDALCKDVHFPQHLIVRRKY